MFILLPPLFASPALVVLIEQQSPLLRPWFSLWLSPCPPWPPSQRSGTWTETSVQRVCFFMSCLYPCLPGLSRAPAASAVLFSLISYIFGILGASLKSHDICESHFSLKNRVHSVRFLKKFDWWTWNRLAGKQPWNVFLYLECHSSARMSTF